MDSTRSSVTPLESGKAVLCSSPILSNEELEARLLAVLAEQNDPRLTEQPCRYEYEPYAGKET